MGRDCKSCDALKHIETLNRIKGLVEYPERPFFASVLASPYAGQGYLVTQKGNVVKVSTLEKKVLPCVYMSDLVLHDSSKDSEDKVRLLRGSGILIARYSKSYSMKSESGNLPEDVGFSLDIPNDGESLYSILTHDKALEAIVSREESVIRGAVSDINSRLKRPIIITPYLPEALGGKEKNVKVKMNAMQVMDGIEYEGMVGFDEHSFRYNLRFDVSLRKLIESEKNIGGRAHWTIRDSNGKKINLIKKYEPLFITTVGNMVLDFYTNPMTRMSQTGLFGRLVRGDEVRELAQGIELPPEMKIGMSIGTIVSLELPKIPLLDQFIEYSKTGNDGT